MSLICCFDKLEQYEAYFKTCQVTSLPLSSNLFSMITKSPCLSIASKSSLSRVSSNPSNSFWMNNNSSSSPKAVGVFSSHSCKCSRSRNFRSEKVQHLTLFILFFSLSRTKILCSFRVVLFNHLEKISFRNSQMIFACKFSKYLQINRIYLLKPLPLFRSGFAGGLYSSSFLLCGFGGLNMWSNHLPDFLILLFEPVDDILSVDR